jgi:dTDP-4-dehydrorhamnose 3,5-epimerase
MKFVGTPLLGAYIVELEPFVDERGLFSRTFCQKEFAEIGFKKQIVQINHSVTRQKGAIRGLHYQLSLACETKIIRCIQGEIFDVMVDIREGSPTFLHWFGTKLSKKEFQLIFIPEGFAHGFQSLTDNVELLYFSSAFYSPEHERGLLFNDPALSIQWPLAVKTISQKDQNHPLLEKNFKGIS